ncbi:unnamed protein product, partial [Ectocarpus fasciculatus]
RPLSAQTEFDVVVVGGGIIGLATAREIRNRYPRKTVCVLEKEAAVGCGMSGHNSGVIHAGMYYEPGSVMAKTCVRGSRLMYEFCDQYKVPYDKTGKLIVATDTSEDQSVQMLYTQGRQNGVPGLEIWDAQQVKQKEPNVLATTALWSPETGIIDYAVVCRVLEAQLLASKRADVKCSFEVNRVTNLDDGRVRVTGIEHGQPGPIKAVVAKNVITCAGLFADRVGRAAGGARGPGVVSFRGSYYQMKEEYKDIVKANVYPVPNGTGIPTGIHFTPTLNEKRGRQTIIGPGACPAFSREGFQFADFKLGDFLDLCTNFGFVMFFLKNPVFSLQVFYEDINKKAFMKQAQKLIPSVTEDMVEESFSGVMCQVFETNGDTAKDYIFERKCMDGKVLNLRSCPSPAATASLAIAEHVVEVAEADFGWK